MADIYLHNSVHKEFIRDKWVEFSTDMLNNESGLSIITFPAEEMHDLHLFAEKGLIEWTLTETGAYSITKGKVVCFEKVSKYFVALNNKLSNAILESNEFGSYLRNKYEGIMKGSTKIFPVDVINLDYDANISKSKVPIDEIIKLIFEYQALHKKNFSLFLTWPETEAEDESRYKELLKQTINDNLSDPGAISFKELYESNNYPDVNDLPYNELSVIGISKIIIQKAAHYKYDLHKNEFYIYGEPGRRQMFSILLNFNFHENLPRHTLYSNSVSKSLVEINDLRKVSTEATIV